MCEHITRNQVNNSLRTTVARIPLTFSGETHSKLTSSSSVVGCRPNAAAAVRAKTTIPQRYFVQHTSAAMIQFTEKRRTESAFDPVACARRWFTLLLSTHSRNGGERSRRECGQFYMRCCGVQKQPRCHRRCHSFDRNHW